MLWQKCSCAKECITGSPRWKPDYENGKITLKRYGGRRGLYYYILRALFGDES